MGHASPAECDGLGMTAALRLAGERALAGLAEAGCVPDRIILDGNHDYFGRPDRVRTVVDGDALCLSVAAASIVAKVTRDRLMAAEAECYPGYDFDSNRGYPSHRHRCALLGYGPTAIHRRLLLLAGVVIYWGLLFLATHMPGDGQLHLPHSIPHLDKLVHAAGFAGLAVLVCSAVSGWWRPGPAMYLVVIGLLAAYAGLDEITQGFVRHRQADVRDWIADLIGTLAGVGLFAVVLALMTSRRAPT